MRAFLAAGILALSFLVLVAPLEAAHRHRHPQYRHFSHRLHVRRFAQARHHVRFSHRRHWHWARPAQQTANRASLVTVKTAAGIPVTVASHLAARFQALIAEFVAAGYRPRHIGCFARSGHVPNSRHYAGAACDFDQRGWGKTAAFMYRAHRIIARHGLRDGCEFRDCGHVDDGVPRYARRNYRSWYRG